MHAKQSILMRVKVIRNRDALVLAEILEEGKSIGLDFGDNLLLKKYSRKRMIDKNLLIQSTHSK